MDFDDIASCVLCGRQVDPETAQETYDSYLCRECMKKLSPFMTDLELADQEDLEEQVELRQKNEELLRSFTPTRCFYLPGMTRKIYMDDKGSRFVAVDPENSLIDNPEIISCADLLYADFHVDDNREKIGDHLFRYSYDLSMELVLEHTYLSEIKFPLTSRTLSYESSEKSFLGFGGFDPMTQPEYQRIADFAADLSAALLQEEESVNHRYDISPEEFREMGGSLKEEEVTCPWCGGLTRVLKDRCCEHCGGNL